MATFTIENEGTRRALEYALWSYVTHEAGDIMDQCSDAGDPRLSADPTAEQRLDVTLTAIRTARADIDQVRGAAEGDDVELSIPAASLAYGLWDCQDFIEEGREQGFWNRPAEREGLLVMRDAAVALRAIVGPAEAVA
jgi:hypothetical protein